MRKISKPKLRFKEFKDDWDYKNLKQISTVKDGDWIESEYIYNSGDYTIIQTGNIGVGNYIGKKKLKYISDDGFKELKAREVHVNDLLICRLAEPVGRAILAPDINKKMVTSVDVAVVYPKRNISKSFLKNLFNSSYMLSMSERMATGSTRIRISRKNLEKIKFNIPKSEKEQSQIGLFFNKIDDLINLKCKKIDSLECLKRGYLQKLFTDPHEDKPKLRFKSFNDNWTSLKLIELSELITKGTTPKSKSGNVNFVKVENIDKDSGDIEIKNHISMEEHEGTLKRSKLKKNDILFSIAGTLGRLAIVSGKIIPANTNQALAIIRLKNKDNNYFIKTLLGGKTVKDYVRKNPTIGAQPNLSLKQVSDLKLSIPNQSEMAEIGLMFITIDKQINLQRKELNRLKSLKKGYLQKMFI